MQGLTLRLTLNFGKKLGRPLHPLGFEIRLRQARVQPSQARGKVFVVRFTWVARSGARSTARSLRGKLPPYLPADLTVRLAARDPAHRFWRAAPRIRPGLWGKLPLAVLRPNRKDIGGRKPYAAAHSSAPSTSPSDSSTNRASAFGKAASYRGSISPRR